MDYHVANPSNRIFIAAAVAVIAVIVVVIAFPFSNSTPTGNYIAKNTTTTVLVEIPINFCGNNICEKAENCDTCPHDCDCVQLKVSKLITYDQFLIWCSAKVQYAAINSGNRDANGVRIELKTEAPHLNAIRDKKDISLGNFPVNMTPIMGEEKLNYDCGDDIVRVSIRLYDQDGHEAVLEEEKR
jgi:hypothetical protein